VGKADSELARPSRRQQEQRSHRLEFGVMTTQYDPAETIFVSQPGYPAPRFCACGLDSARVLDADTRTSRVRIRVNATASINFSTILRVYTPGFV